MMMNNSSMMMNSFVSELEYDSDEIRHHAHSDQDETDTDPFYEYNKCSAFTFLEK